jgi:hypothetical protein
VGVGQSEKGGQRRWSRFNASVLAREGRRWDEALSEDEAKAASLSWLHGKKVWHSAMAWWRQTEERRHRGGEMDEALLIGLTRILLQKNEKKSTWSIQLLQMDGEDLKQQWVNLIFFKHMQVRSSFVHLIALNTMVKMKF